MSAREGFCGPASLFLHGGQCYFEGQPLPFELEDMSDDGNAVGGVATADDKDSETQGNQPTKSPKSASQKKSPRGSLAMSKSSVKQPVHQPEPQRPTRDTLSHAKHDHQHERHTEVHARNGTQAEFIGKLEIFCFTRRGKTSCDWA